LSSSSLNSYSSGLGSSGYGGYSSYGGGYGGYGGLSSLYGGGMFGGLGGMYGGMYGLGSAEGQEKGFLTNTLAALQSFGFLIYSLGEIGKTLETNIDGIHKFYESFKSTYQLN
jgi:peroxin-13